jgi:RHS repeat-associated protein
VTQVLARFRYDSRNRRVARWLPSTGWTYFVNGPDGSPLGEATLTTDPAQPWSRQRDYVWLDGRPLAQVEYPGPVGSSAGYAYYVHADHIGLPRVLTNQGGQVVWSAAAWPYGDLVETTTPDPLSGRTVVTNLRLPGQYDERLLESVGLQGPYYNWNRWYLPGVGRYLELDPVALVGGTGGGYPLEWYGYARTNPLRFVDPDGSHALADKCAEVTEEAQRFAKKIRDHMAWFYDYFYMDRGHKKEVKQYQNRLRDLIAQIKRFCPCPDPNLLKDLEWLANLDVDDVPETAPREQTPTFPIVPMPTPIPTPMPIPVRIPVPI